MELKSGRDRCVKDFDNDGDLSSEHEICVQNIRDGDDDIYACNIKIDKMHKDLEGMPTLSVTYPNARS